MTIANPISQDRSVLRQTLLPNMLDIAASNLRYTNRVALYEIGTVFLTRRAGETEPGDLPEDAGLPIPLEPRRLGFILSGPRDTQTWQDASSKTEPAGMDFYDLKGIVQDMLDGLHIRDAGFVAAPNPLLHPGRAAALTIGGATVGIFGELHPVVRERWELPAQPVLVGEFDLDAILDKMDERYIVKPISRYPVIIQDIALIVDEQTGAAPIEALIRQTGGALLNSVALFDVYRGAPLASGKKSLAYTLTFQALDHVLSDTEAAKIREKIVRRLEREFSAELRSS